MKERAVVIGGGINGLVAANYLQRNGYAVTLLERKDNTGGACTFETLELNGKSYDYPSAATVLGFMQDFVFEETGLSKNIELRCPEHPAVVWFQSSKEPCFMYSDIEMLKSELRDKWNEQGNVEGFYNDLARVCEFLYEGYRNAHVPTLESARAKLGEETSKLWITGSARKLLDHYFTSDQLKVFWAIEVNESGPVSIDSAYSAFTIPLLGSGTVFDGEWGFVKGGLWKLTEELSRINRELGVQIIESAQVLSVLPEKLEVAYAKNGEQKTISCDRVLFATDPLSAAKLLGDQELIADVSGKTALGSSGKLIMLFDKAIEWQNNTGAKDFDSAFKFIISVNNLDEFERTSQAVSDGGSDFVPGYFELYCEGAGMASLNADRGYDALTVFFKNLSLSKNGAELPEVKAAVENIILSRIENKQDHVASILLTPQDLKEKFFFPEGNIDHIELSEGQTFFARNFSPDPSSNFYQFGRHEQISYCAAGSYPCGSIAGTSAYICVQQLLRTKSNCS